MAPITYRLGALDPRFGIGREALRHRIEEAADIWSAAAGRKLFRLDDKGPLAIHLIYDSRQETMQRMTAVRAGIADALQEADAIKERLLPLRARVRALQEAYAARLAAHQRALENHNRIVRQANQNGGAPADAYDRLGAEARALQQEEIVLKAAEGEIGGLVGEINAQVRTHNAILDRANAQADAQNKSGAVGAPFEQGRYLREAGQERIEIYEFDGETALVVILAHELGHALGIRHNANPSAIMSPLVHARTAVLTSEDLQGLNMACLPQ